MWRSVARNMKYLLDCLAISIEMYGIIFSFHCCVRNCQICRNSKIPSMRRCWRMKNYYLLFINVIQEFSFLHRVRYSVFLFQIYSFKMKFLILSDCLTKLTSSWIFRLSWVLRSSTNSAGEPVSR